METKIGNEKNLLMKEEQNKLRNDIINNEKSFIDFISQRLGISVSHCQVDELRKAILNACSTLKCTPVEYLKSLKELPDRSPLLENLIASVTVGETYFFRDKVQMDLLQQTLLPTLISQKREQKNLSLRIWSAGCATGEEIYTIAMQLHEILPDIKEWKLNLLGTDINTESLKKAISGQYTEWSMRAITNEYKNHYFSKKENQYEISTFIRNLVKFDYLNLNDDSYPSIFNGTNAQDLILCRNVLIYFNATCTHRLMQKLSASLAPDGFLLLGASDPIDIKDIDLSFHQNKGMLFSHKPSDQKKSITISSFLNIKEIEKKPEPLSPIAYPAKKTRDDLPVTNIIDEQLIAKLLNENKWQEALEVINQYELNQPKSASVLSAKANVLANLGKLEEAEKLSQESLILDSTNKYTHFTYALILIELNKINEAEKMLRKSIFLDHEFVAGYYQLGLLLIRNKQQTMGLKSLRNALSIAKAKDPAQFIRGSHGLSYGRLAEMLEYELTLYTQSGIDNENKESAD